VAGLGEQAQMERRERLTVAHMRKQRALLGAILVDEGHRWGGRARSAHG
jgi:hypothetical protein